MTAIELERVTKRYGGVTALDGVDLTVRDGEVFGFLGPNGAGKSTTIDLLLDYARPTAGEVEVLGMDARERSKAIRQRTGVLPEGFDVYDRLTGRRHVEFAMESKEVGGDPYDYLGRVGLTAEEGDRKAGGYSKGMAQRLVLAMALVGDPDLLILDEPSTGLDPNGARRMREIVREERDRGATVFFSSHILGQVEAVCDRVGILRDGRLVAEDSIDSLRERAGADTTLTVTVDRVTDGLTATVRGMAGVSAVSADGTQVTVSCDDEVKIDVLYAIEETGARVENFDTQDASLEDLFMAYTEGRA